MLLSELFDYLVSGELSQVSLGDYNDLAIDVDDYPKIIPTINLARTELFKRFPLRVDEVIIRQQAHIQVYELHSRFAASNEDSDEKIKYIHDSIYEPFRDNLLKVEQVYNELGMEIPLNEDIDYNEDEDYWSSKFKPYIGAHRDYDFQAVRTPTPTSVQILPHPLADNNLLVKYRAAPDAIPSTPDLIPGETEIGVPLALLEPLLLYVGGRYFRNSNGDDPNGGVGFMTSFEAACKRIENLNLFNTGNVTNTKLRRAGWA